MLLTESDVDCPINKTFSGDDLTNPVEFWMRKFKEHAQGRGLTLEGTLEVAKRKLAGSARTWFSYQENINSWERFEESILAEFKTNSSNIHIQEVMGSKKKQPSQSVMNYIHEMRLLGYRAQMDDTDIMEMIIKGATEDKYLRAILRTVTSFQMLRKVLEGFEEDAKNHNTVIHCPKTTKALPYSRTSNLSKPQISLPATQAATVSSIPSMVTASSLQPIIVSSTPIAQPAPPVYNPYQNTSYTNPYQNTNYANPLYSYSYYGNK